MAHISSIQASIFTQLAFNPNAVATLSDGNTQAKLVALFATAPTQVANIREFPEFGAPANIVNVPVYGKKTSVQVQGQSDSPTLEFTLNYVPAEHAAVQAMVGNGQLYAFQISLTSQEPANLLQIPTTGIGTPVGNVNTNNTVFNFLGKFESFLVTPSLTDSTQAKITLSMQTEMFGPATYASV
jgi:hypothetical protein